MPNDPISKTMEQHRANYAWRSVQNAKARLNPTGRKEYLSLTRKFPSMVLTNGLGQTLAFVHSKAKMEEKEKEKGKEKETPEAILGEQIASWLRDVKTPTVPGLPIYKNGPTDTGARTQGAEILYRIASGSSDDLRRATTEVLALCSWIKRIAEAEIKEQQ